MKKFLLFFALIALFTTNAIATTGDIFEYPVTHVDPNGKKTKIMLRFQIFQENEQLATIYGEYDLDLGIKNCIVADYDNKPGEIVVPETVNGYTVKKVGPYAFSNCVAKVTLPESVVAIEYNAFDTYLYDGYDFKLPSNMWRIGQFAFKDAKIKDISLNGGLNIIGKCAFTHSDIESLIIPGTVAKIEAGITIGCNNLEYLAVTTTNKTYYSDHNVVMHGATKRVVAGCRSSVIPEDATNINEQAFAGINFTNTTLTIPESVDTIGTNAFQSTNIKHLIIHQPQLIGEQAFLGCEQMERVDFYGGNVTLGNKAFYFCSALKEMWCHNHKPNILYGKEQFEYVGPDWDHYKGQTKIFAKYPDEFTDEVEGKGNIWEYWFYPHIYGLDDNPVIGSIYLDGYTWPLAGEDADFTANSLTLHATVSKIEYRSGTKIIDPSPCALGGKFDIGFTINLDEGYTFADNAPLFVGGDQPNLVVKRSDTERVYILQDYTVPAPPGGVPIKAVSVNVEEPVEGQPLSTKVTWPTERAWRSLDWSLDSVVWTGGNLDSYDPTKSYTLTVYVHANTADYRFSPDIVAKLNDKTAGVKFGTNSEGISTLALSIHYGLQVYTVFDEDYSTLTYYYDGWMYSRNGVKEVYDPVNNLNIVRFKDYSDKVVKAVIDPSMKDAPLTSTARMFYGGESDKPISLSALTEIEGLGYLNTKNVTSMSNMFDGCVSLKSVDLSSFKTANVVSMQFMFYNCKSLTELDLTSFKNSNLYSITGMFHGCSSLTTIWCNTDWSEIENHSLTTMYSPFTGCTALEGGKDTKYDRSMVSAAYARPDGGEDAPGYFTFKAIKGDVNNDGDVNSGDVVAVYSYIINGAESGFTFDMADVNGDGEVNSADVVAIYNIIINGNNPQPDETDENTFTVNNVIKFKMVEVEGGTFQMGSEDEDSNDDEKPVHNVTLSSYCIGQTEVTQALWEAVMGSHSSEYKGYNLPVERVTWNDCQEFISKLNLLFWSNLGLRKFRLPTEAEWEFAARGGNKSNGYTYSGSNTIDDVAWYNSNSNKMSHPVGTKAPNELGIYDMSGNVAEWCQDWYGSYSSKDQTDPTGVYEGTTKVWRGGTWYYKPKDCRVTSRENIKRTGYNMFLGLRLVLSD